MNARARKWHDGYATSSTTSFRSSMKREVGTMLRIIQKVFAENWILITNDKDFGEKVYREGHPHHGVIFLRLSDERAANKIDVLSRLLNTYAAKLPNQFVVVTETRVRCAKT